MGGEQVTRIMTVSTDALNMLTLRWRHLADVGAAFAVATASAAVCCVDLDVRTRSGICLSNEDEGRWKTFASYSRVGR